MRASYRYRQPQPVTTAKDGSFISRVSCHLDRRGFYEDSDFTGSKLYPPFSERTSAQWAASALPV